VIAIDKSTHNIIGTYRINSAVSIDDIQTLYSSAEFETESLPVEVILNGSEIGRACISERHRGSKALFLIWKALAKYLVTRKKRYFFGCCSIFTGDRAIGAATYHKLIKDRQVHPEVLVKPRHSAIAMDDPGAIAADCELPNLFEMYLRLGARVCGPPMYDEAFGSVDFFVLFDLAEMNERYRRMFFS